MKKILCAILTLVCILALCSCNLLDKFISTESDERSTTTMPQSNDVEVTTPEQVAPEENDEDQNKGLLVSVYFQSGGVHQIRETMGLPEGSTFADCFNSFMTYHDLWNYNVICYYNNVAVEPDATFHLRHADEICIIEVGELGVE